MVGEDCFRHGGHGLLDAAAPAGLQEEIHQRQLGKRHDAGQTLTCVRFVRQGTLLPGPVTAGLLQGNCLDRAGADPPGGEEQEHLFVPGDGQQARQLTSGGYFTAQMAESRCLIIRFEPQDAPAGIVNQQGNRYRDGCGSQGRQSLRAQPKTAFKQVKLVFQVGDGPLIFLHAAAILQGNILCQQFLVPLGEVSQASGNQFQDGQGRSRALFDFLDPFFDFWKGHGGKSSTGNYTRAVSNIKVEYRKGNLLRKIAFAIPQYQV